MFESRIKVAACPYIELNDVEAELYHGSGNAIAYVTDKGQIEKFIYLTDLDEDGAQDACNAALDHGNAYLGMCSTYTFCEPQKLGGQNPALFARIARLVAENYDLDGVND